MSKFIEINTIRNGKIIINTDIIASVRPESFTTDEGKKCNARILTRSSGPVIASDYCVIETYEQLKEMLMESKDISISIPVNPCEDCELAYDGIRYTDIKRNCYDNCQKIKDYQVLKERYKKSLESK